MSDSKTSDPRLNALMDKLRPVIAQFLAEERKGIRAEVLAKIVEATAEAGEEQEPLADIDIVPQRTEEPAAAPQSVDARTPRGTVPEAIAEVLRDHPGSLSPFIVEEVLKRRPEISKKSVSNTLFAMKGVKFERTGENRAYHWYNIGEVPLLRAAE